MLTARIDRNAAPKQPNQRGGAWTLGEVLAELLPQYGLSPNALDSSAPAALVLNTPTAPEHELFACAAG